MKPTRNITGERLETAVFNLTTIEHLHRYAVALDFVAGKKVLDIACGEGYGAKLLAKSAVEVMGVDIDQTVIEEAKKKYTGNNLQFREGSTSSIPAEDNYFDTVISFETLEHVEEHDQFLAEIKRVLKPGGQLLISTPDKHQYTELANYKNPYHKKELYEKDFKELLKKYFPCVSFYRQASFIGSSIVKETDPMISTTYSGDYTSVSQENAPPYLYHIAIASAIPGKEIIPSLFQDQQLLTRLLQEQQAALKRTITYRAGNTILYPFKFIRSLFQK
ncbi:MAG: class I SAM-dependent methyltransferase [Bacteroidota bacterium]|nr:class I SAM-dependent methyltransferase [Bacteroidota bacterium]